MRATRGGSLKSDATINMYIFRLLIALKNVLNNHHHFI